MTIEFYELIVFHRRSKGLIFDKAQRRPLFESNHREFEGLSSATLAFKRILFRAIFNDIVCGGQISNLDQLQDRKQTLRIYSKELSFWVYSMVTKSLMYLPLHLCRISDLARVKDFEGHRNARMR